MADDSLIRLRINGERYDLDVQDLDLEEADLLEESAGGVPLGSMTPTDWNRVRVLKVIAFVAVRRKQPDYTLEQAGRLKVGQIEVVGEDDPPTTEDSPEPVVASAPKSPRRSKSS